MAVFGHVGILDEKLELFADYADRCDAFIAANDVAVVGVIAYKLLKDLCSPNLPNTKSYGDLKKLLQDHYSPRPIVIAERHKILDSYPRGERIYIMLHSQTQKRCGGEHNELIAHTRKLRAITVNGNHLQRVCRSGGQHGSSENTNTRHRGGLRPNHFKAGHANTKHVADGNQEAEDSVYLDGVQDERYQSEGFGLYNVTSNYSVSPYMIRMSVGKGKADNISMEIDTGATRSTISESAYMSELANMYPLKKCDFALRSYTVKTKRSKSLGDIGALRKSEIVLPTCQPCDPEGFRELLEKHRKLFSDKDTGIKDFTASLKLKPNAKSTYQKSRAVPYSMVDKVEQEYNRLIEADILTPVTSSKWASPTVHVPKANGSVRVCGDYKQVNSIIEDDGYTVKNNGQNLPNFLTNVGHVFSNLKSWAKIDQPK
ncbi:hypothetical protein BSL78_18309 [Apostichopus japonicus]|uniref:Peptidase A2 domain-containing protein n=1 Tax=Stichopus japonicus TaxID=307972 RepID=A0A2G8KA17_STIJA|nr:hypothetical protein BSL78_18309 [Apostichopus japonicus]